jgi:hypothetical protein
MEMVVEDIKHEDVPLTYGGYHLSQQEDGAVSRFIAAWAVLNEDEVQISLIER